MIKTTMEYVTVRKNGIIQKVGNGTIYSPKTNFKGGSVKWAEDKKKATK